MMTNRLRSALVLMLFSVGIRAQMPLSIDGISDQQRILTYISNGWEKLSRSMSQCSSVVDTKVTTVPVLYLPFGMGTPPDVIAMRRECHVDVRHLPRVIHHIGDLRPSDLSTEGLLYLPRPYIVPGGRFNEMYGWDSYFMILGLLADGHRDMAQGMIENFFFEIEHYGALLNANRSYYLTRSQPPFLSSMIRAVYEYDLQKGRTDRRWLARAYNYATRDYALWSSTQHRAGDTGLARYHDLGEGPVPEMSDDSTYYPDVIRSLLVHPGEHSDYLVKGSAEPDQAEAVTLAKTSCDVHQSRVCREAVVDGHRLSRQFYEGDRAMRESGFDTTFRFGPFSGSTQDFAPVGLNSLLFRYERDMSDLARLLGRQQDVKLWASRAEARRAAIDHYLWNPSAGLYFDYDLRLQRQSTYHFITTFYPLWAGAASNAQALSVEQHLAIFDRPGGLATSDVASGVQWDLPYGWAPTTWLAVSGLERYQFHEDAVQISKQFSDTVLENFMHDGTIREKYNVVSRSANVEVSAGYTANVIGFGWTNGVYLKMQQLLNAPAPFTKADRVK